MSVIDAAREYIIDATNRGVGAVSTAAVAKRLSVTEEQAIALLNCLVEAEGIATVHGSVSCPDCLEQIDLKGKKLSDLIREAERLAGQPCPICDDPLPASEDLKVQLYFFYKAVAPTGATAQKTTNSAAVTNFLSGPLPLSQLKDIQGLCDTFILALPGSTVMTGDRNTQASTGSIVNTGDHGSLHDIASGGRDARLTNVTPSVSVPPTMPTIVKPFYKQVQWPVISVVFGVLVGLAGWLFLPNFSYRNVAVVSLGLIATIVAFRMNPLYWARWLVGLVVLSWLGATLVGLSAKLFADIPGIAKFKFTVELSAPAAAFHLAVVMVVGFLLIYDYLQRRAG